MLSSSLYRNISEIKTVIHCLKQRLKKLISVTHENMIFYDHL